MTIELNFDEEMILLNAFIAMETNIMEYIRNRENLIGIGAVPENDKFKRESEEQLASLRKLQEKFGY